MVSPISAAGICCPEARSRLHARFKRNPSTPIVLVASGPSLCREDIELCVEEGVSLAVVNDCYRLAPWADLLYACDKKWWDYHKPKFSGEKWTQSREAANAYGLHHISGTDSPGLSLMPGLIYFGGSCVGGNSGFQLLNLIVLMGARNIVLLGYDMQTDGQDHWFGRHPDKLFSPPNFRNWIGMFEMAARQLKEIGVSVTNCTRSTALDCFPCAHLKNVI